MTGPCPAPALPGSVWYHTRFRLDESTGPEDLLALYIERACSNVQVTSTAP
jgi:hypothetical protein